MLTPDVRHVRSVSATQPDMSVRHPLRRRGTADTDSGQTAHTRATGAAANLLRTALLSKLAVDLDDPRLARRAAREAITSARRLTGIEFPDRREWLGYGYDGPLPDVDDLLDQLHPGRLPSRDDLEETAPEPAAPTGVNVTRPDSHVAGDPGSEGRERIPPPRTDRPAPGRGNHASTTPPGVPLDPPGTWIRD